jgi:dynein heavy chain
MELDFNQLNTRLRKLPRSLKDWKAFLNLRDQVELWLKMLPLLNMLTLSSISQRHWDLITNISKSPTSFDPERMTVSEVFARNLDQLTEEIETICSSAKKEVEIEGKLRAISEEWISREFVFGPFKNRGNIILKSLDTAEIIASIDDSLVVLNSLMNNRFNGWYLSLFSPLSSFFSKFDVLVAITVFTMALFFFFC